MTELERTAPPPAQERRRGFGPLSIAAIAAAAVFVVMIGVQLTRQNAPSLQPGRTAPDFTVTSFDGETITLSEQRGKVVIVNFWASWCGPCHDEAPVLENIWQTYGGDDLLLLGLTHADVERDSRAFIDRYGMSFPNAPDPAARIYEQYNLLAVPESFIIGPDGQLEYALHGPITEDNLPTIISTIERLLEEPA